MHFTEEQIVRVKRATARFEERIRNLYQPLAQVMTGRRSLRVLPHPSSSFTDGKAIWLHLPMELADDTEHTKELCGERDPATKEMICKACKTIDNIDGVCFHEINHIVHESFLKVDSEARRKAIVAVVTEKFPDDPGKVDSLIRKMEMLGVEDAMSIAHGLDLWLPMLTNALEDIFVNERGFEARPGTELPIVASNRRFLVERFEDVEGNLHGWADRDLDSQAIIAVYAKGAGYEEEMKVVLSDEVQPLVADPRIQDVLSRVRGAKHPVDRLHLAIEALSVLREYGFCVDSRSELFESTIIVVLTDKDEDDEDEDEDKYDLNELREEFDVEVIDMRSERPEADDEEDSDEGGGDESSEDEDEPTTTSATKGSNPDSEQDTDGSEGEDDEDDDGKDEDGEEDDANGDADSGSSLEGDQADEDADGEGDAELDDDDHKPESRGDDSEVDDADEWGSGDESAESLSDDIEDGDDDADTDRRFGADTDTDSASDKETEADVDVDRELEIKAAQRAAEDLKRAMGHSDDREGSSAPSGETELLELWINQRDFFDDPSYNVRKVRNIEPDDRYLDDYVLERAPGVNEVNPVLGPMRVAFTENAKMGIHRSLKAGNRLDTAHLYRVPLEDPRVFARRELPHKRDWFVVIGCDCSGSTSGQEIETIRQGAYAMAELLSRLGIRFAVYGHSGDYEGRPGGRDEEARYSLTMFHVKNPSEPWNEAARKRCLSLEAHRANLDGHTLEFYRRVAMSERASDRLVMYFTDGSMPAENYSEELTILQRNIQMAERQKVRVVGVAVQNDDPKRYGLDTIRYDHIGQLPYLVKELGKRLV